VQPGDEDPLEHHLDADPDVGLTDYIVKEKIFNFYLYLGCVALTEEQALMSRMMTDPKTSWKKPVEVFGYNYAVHFGGTVFEAETNCIPEHNMGQVASSGVNNFSFTNKKQPITSPDYLKPYMSTLLKTRDDIEQGNLVFNESMTYLTLILGDGDNIAFMKGRRRGWMYERLEFCEQRGDCGVPLMWSMSPHLAYLAPDWLQWYYENNNKTGMDVFMLPPSGHLYAYPGMMHKDESLQDSFVESTAKDCELLWAKGSVHWEWFFGWKNAFDTYFPKFSNGSDNCVTSFFATNVPYLFQPDEDEWEPNEFYRVVGGNVFVFKPREWRGDSVGSIPDLGLNFLTAEEMSAEINGYPGGTVTQLYLTSDGGLNLELLFSMVDLLNDHVKIVNHEELEEMARQRTFSKILV